MRSFFNKRNETDPYMYTDLAVERRRCDGDMGGVKYTSERWHSGTLERVRILTEEGELAMGRPSGNYYTLNVGRFDLLSDADIEDVTEDIARLLCIAVDGVRAYPERILTVGLGNRRLGCDSVGPRAAARIRPTMHIKELDPDTFTSLACSEIAVLAPGVTAESGIGSSEVIRGVCRRIMPDLVIAIDAIATRSEERLCSTVQISDTGLFPGSGIGNYSSELTERTLGIPIISVGIPTVIDSRIFRMNGVLDGELSGESMLVSPKEIDEISDVAAEIIGCAVNQAFGISSDV
jgi:spore protease